MKLKSKAIEKAKIIVKNIVALYFGNPPLILFSFFYTERVLNIILWHSRQKFYIGQILSILLPFQNFNRSIQKIVFSDSIRLTVVYTVHLPEMAGIYFFKF